MATVRMMTWDAYGNGKPCVVVGDLVRETPKSYVFSHPFFTSGDEKRVSQSGAYHVEPCKFCRDFRKGL